MGELAKITETIPFSTTIGGITMQEGTDVASTQSVYSRRSVQRRNTPGLDARFDERAQDIYAGFDPKTVFFPGRNYEHYPDAPQGELQAVTEALNSHGQRCLDLFRTAGHLKDVVWLGLVGKDGVAIVEGGKVTNKDLETTHDEWGTFTRSPQTDIGVVGPRKEDSEAITIAMGVADCLAVSVMDERTEAFGLAHAGRTGTALRTSQKAAETILNNFSSRQRDMVAYIGEGVCTACYPLDERAIDSFIADFGGRTEVNKVLDQYPTAIQEFDFGGQKTFTLDHYAFNKFMLADKVHEIVVAANCTARSTKECISVDSNGVPTERQQDFFSHRRVNGQTVGWTMANGETLELNTAHLTTPRNLAAITRY